VNLNEIQWTPLTDPAAGQTRTAQHGAVAAALGEERADQPDAHGSRSEIALHIHPEDQLTHTVRGTLEQGVMDGSFPRQVRRATCCTCPAAWCTRQAGEIGADQLDVFWPVRPDYVERARKQQALYEQVVAPGASRRSWPTASRSPKADVLEGTLYFSDMFFKNPPPKTGPAARAQPA
jgi:gluconolactonase